MKASKSDFNSVALRWMKLIHDYTEQAQCVQVDGSNAVVVRVVTKTGNIFWYWFDWYRGDWIMRDYFWDEVRKEQYST